ncbi:glycoside hydrolase superfamily [Mycena metata]|uniref:beta-glucosidase n=1 Tax=Mycena metata TaxID=1033252 RepID=A0AAD7H229_9AGAR|nr:glycoside hydrolase superfamily [Mycena metata]
MYKTQLFTLLVSTLAFPAALADVVTGEPDPAPPGFEQWVSPVIVPSPPVIGTGDWASAVARAKNFVAGLTLEEKINVTTGVDLAGRCVGNTGTIPRLGWNGICLQDSPLGVRLAQYVSAFPAGINAAATWDTALIEARGKAMGAEFRGKGVNVALGPMTNMGRQAASGRNWEGFGADPFLSGSNGVIATVKHFIGNEQEHFRGGSEASQIYSSNIDDKTLHELYLWPFAEAVKAGVGAVMCAYNKINQTQACQNSKLVNGALKEELGFMGFIMSDWAALIDGIQPALAGLDMNMPGFFAYNRGPQTEADPVTAVNGWWGAHLLEMVNNGSVPEARVDDMVTRTFSAFYKLGQDKNYPAVTLSQNDHVNVQSDHYKLIRQIGAASTILLKNTKNVFPLSVKNIKRIAIVGSDAGPNPDGANGCSDRGCSQGTLAMGWGSGTTNFPYLIDPLTAITTHIQSINPTVVIEAVLNDFNLNQVSAVAGAADTCLVFVNADSGEGYLHPDDNQGDRNNITLWHGGEALIAAAAAACANTIVVQHVVGPVTVEDWTDHPNVTAVLHAGLPGQESGNALVDVLFADGTQATNPSGRLPYTIARARADYPADVLYTSSDGTPQITYEEALGIDYRWFDMNNITPRFEFGFGLSYTTFGYSGLSTSKSHFRREEEKHTASAEAVSTARADLGGPSALYQTALTVSFRVQNTGPVAGNEVSQLYLTFPAGYGEPPKVLRGFARTLLQRGQSKMVEIPLRVKDVSVWDVVQQKWVVPRGTFTVHVGASSRILPLTGTFTL